MLYIFTLLYIIIAVIGYFKMDKFIVNPITVMFGIWAVLLPLSSFGAYEVPPISDKANLIIFVGLMGYLIGNASARPTKIKIGNCYLANPEKKYTFNYTFLYILYSVSAVYLIGTFIVAFRMMLDGYSLSYIRGLVTVEGNNELRSSMLSILIKNFISTPTVYLAIAIMPIEMIMGKKKKSLIIMTLIMIFCWVISVGGRSILLWTVIYFITVILLAGKDGFQINISKKAKTIAVVISVILIAFLLWSTYSRKGSGFDMIRELFIYYVAPLKHFDKYVELIDYSYPNLYGYGGASFYGFWYPILYAIRIFTGASGYSDFWTTIRDLSFNRLEHTTWLGGDIHMNAFVTMFYQPYIDGRFIGVFVICFLFGYLCNYSYIMAHDHKNLKYFLIYLLLLQKITDSMVRFYFTQTSQAVCIIYALFAVVPIMRKNKKQTRDLTD